MTNEEKKTIKDAIRILKTGPFVFACTESIRILEELDLDPIFECPKCGGNYFGSSGEDHVIAHCYDERGRGCHWSGPRKECGLEELK